MTYKYNFFNDLKNAKKEELLAAECLLDTIKKLDSIKETFQINNDNRYDFSFTRKNGNKITFEVKDDDYTFKSDNVGIEFKCRNKDSGINITKADYWIHKIRGVFYCYRTSLIRSKIEKKCYEWIHDCAGDAYSFTHMYMFKQEKFIKWGRPLRKNNETNINS
jgi:hypothetical protein